jgi:hypothetical protein
LILGNMLIYENLPVCCSTREYVVLGKSPPLDDVVPICTQMLIS